jgi:hypothetical protein
MRMENTLFTSIRSIVTIVKKLFLFFLMVPALFTLQSMSLMQQSDGEITLETMTFDIPKPFTGMFQLEKIQDRYYQENDTLFLKFKGLRSPEYENIKIQFFNNFNIAMAIALSSETPNKAYVTMYFHESIQLNQSHPITIKIPLELIWQGNSQSDFKKNLLNDCCQQIVMLVDFILSNGGEYLCMQCKNNLYHNDESSETLLMDDFYIAPGRGWLCKSCVNQQRISDNTLVHITAMEISHSLVLKVSNQLKARNNLYRNDKGPESLLIDDLYIASSM